MCLSASLRTYIFFENQILHSFCSFSIHLEALHLSENTQENNNTKEEYQECRQCDKNSYSPFTNKNTNFLLYSVFY